MVSHLANKNKTIKKISQNELSTALLTWAKEFGRHHLPWQSNPTAYSVWVSEVMLQQTQVTTVIPYYQKFLINFPSIHALASAELEQVLALWSGLGYYARARNLHRCAKLVVEKYNGNFPDSIDKLENLPGIGRSTAGAIASLAMNKSTPILDGNCKRVYARYFMIKGHYSKASVLRELWQLAEQVTPQKNTAEFNQAIMDLGSMVCTRTKPLCLEKEYHCPLSKNCAAYNHKRISEFPHKKPKKKVKVKSAIFVVVKNQENETLLTKRAPQGIWGGLWSFPQFDNEQDCYDWLTNNFTQYKMLTLSEPKQHTFTHFVLNYRELNIQASVNDMITTLNESNNETWFPVSDALQLGLPTPIKKSLLLIERN